MSNKPFPCTFQLQGPSLLKEITVDQKHSSATNGGIFLSRRKSRLFGRAKTCAIYSILTVSLQPLAAWAVTAPTISPGTGVQTAPVSTVTITATPGDTIHYTTNGTQPTSSSPTYTAPLTIGDTAVIKALATSGGVDSAITESYIQNAPNTLLCPGQVLKSGIKATGVHSQAAVAPSTPGWICLAMPLATTPRKAHQAIARL
ncbi:MAG: chitobiase/beta-hexosaminidase C-terminal domain-containing protein [Candidatus Obscuribacter sp.]|nr:chitobiase/beta-hexosaminidase C-terminal domain-containing protein [Candidatus Obscuribacter sp.]